MRRISDSPRGSIRGQQPRSGCPARRKHIRRKKPHRRRSGRALYTVKSLERGSRTFLGGRSLVFFSRHDNADRYDREITASSTRLVTRTKESNLSASTEGNPGAGLVPVSSGVDKTQKVLSRTWCETNVTHDPTRWDLT